MCGRERLGRRGDGQARPCYSLAISRDAPNYLDPARLTMSMTTSCCAECGEEGGVSLKTCKECMTIKYCGATCQRKHWPKHKKDCKIRAVELRDEALFKDPPAKEDCPICFLPMPGRLICCISLPPATISSVPIYDFGIAHTDHVVLWEDYL